MNDIDTRFRTLDLLDTPDLSGEVHRRAAHREDTPAIPSLPRHGRRLAAAIVAIAVFAAAALLLAHAFRSVRHQQSQHHGIDSGPWSSYARGWTQLPPPPDSLQGKVSVLAGDKYFVAGVPSSVAKPELAKVLTGYLFDPSTNRWTKTRPAPTARLQADGVWTGTYVIVWGGFTNQNLVNGIAYDPATDTWRSVPAAPIRPRSASVVWTGKEMIVWGGYIRGEGGQADGAAFDPATWSWHPIAKAPLPLSAATALWSGDRMVVFGADLNSRNHASTPTTVAESYDPSTDSWQQLPASPLSAQASSGAVIDGRLIAYDYELRTATFDGQAWRVTTSFPTPGSECYPDAASTQPFLFAWYCGVAALYDPSTEGWQVLHGGPLKATVTTTSGATYQEFRFADLASTGSGVVLDLEGVTVGRSVCYGCPGARTQLWFYRPPETLSPTPSILSAKDQAHLVLQDFEGARTFHTVALMRPVLANDATLGTPLYSDNFRLSTHEQSFSQAPSGEFVAVVQFPLQTGGFEADKIVIGKGTALDGHEGLVVLSVTPVS